MMLSFVQPAAALAVGDEVEFTGTVTAIDVDAGSFTVDVGEGVIYTVYPAEGFDFSTLVVGDIVEVEGTLNEDGSVAASSVKVKESDDEVEFTGKVIAIDEAAGSFTVEAEDGTTYTVFPPEGFDFSTLEVGDTVEVKGTLNEDGSVAALNVNFEDDETDDPSTGYYCTQSEDQHPFGARLAESYETDYATLQAWFCEGLGWGQIMLALQTGKLTGDDPAALLEARKGGAGWGEIWKELKLIGRPEQAGPPNDEDGDGRPDIAGPHKEKVENGKPDFPGFPKDKDGDGKPDAPGRPEDKDGDGKPDFDRPNKPDRP
jgi:hypothetical protein